jgi:hypothetical protein
MFNQKASLGDTYPFEFTGGSLATEQLGSIDRSTSGYVCPLLLQCSFVRERNDMQRLNGL